MKKLLLLLVPAIVLFSCNDDNDDINISAEATWKLTSITTSEPTDINNDGTATTNFIAETNCYNNSNLILSQGNTANAMLEELEISLDLFNGNTNQLEYSVFCGPATDTFGTWSQETNTVTVIIENEPVIFTLDGNTLSTTLPEFVSFEVLENNVYVSKSFGANLVFTRQ